MKKAVIYPYGKKSEPLIRHCGLLKEYEIIGLVSPSGWGLGGETVTINQNGRSVDLKIQSDFNELEELADIILVPEADLDEKFECKLTDTIVLYSSKVDEVLSAIDFSDQNERKIIDACRKDKTSFKKTHQVSNFQLELNEKSLRTINVPIITIMSQWNDMDKLEVSLSLREKFIRDGYSVSQIGSRAYSGLFDFYAFPDFMLEPTIGEETKVLLFNRFIEEISKEENPDVIIITVPGAIQNLNQDHLNGSGILPYLVAQAITTDILILNVFYEPRHVQFLDELSNLCTYRFGTPITFCHMTNMFIDMASTKEKKRVVVNKVFHETVQETIEKNFKSSAVPLFNMNLEKEAEAAYQSILNVLCGNS